MWRMKENYQYHNLNQKPKPWIESWMLEMASIGGQRVSKLNCDCCRSNCQLLNSSKEAPLPPWTLSKKSISLETYACLIRFGLIWLFVADEFPFRFS